MSNPPKRIVVTGGAGFIGSNLVRKLLCNRYLVLNIDKLTYAGNANSLTDVENHPQYGFAHADIADREQVGKLVHSFRPDSIVHLAAESHVDRSIDGPEEFIRANVFGTFTLLRAAHTYWHGLSDSGKSAFRFVHVSTDEVYGSLGAEGGV